MKRMAVLAASIPLAFALLGFQAPPPAAKPAARPTPTPPPVLEGTVKGPDGKPVEKALVIARPVDLPLGETPLYARTDAAGRFQIRLTSGGLHHVRVEAAGLAAKKVEKVRAGAPLAVTLAKGATIEGTVRDSHNAPVPKARVVARDDSGLGGPGLFEPDAGVLVTTTDAKGQFRIEGVGPGLHSLTARARRAGYGRRANVRPGSRVDLLLLPGATIFGRATGPRGEPVAGATVTTGRDEIGPLGDSPVETTDSSGQFELLGLPPGTHWLVVRHKDFAPGVVTGVTLEREASAKVDVTLGPGLRVIGRLVGGDGRPVKGKVHVQEVDERRAPRSLSDLLRAEAGLDGRFELPPAPPGSYALAVGAPGHAGQRVEVNVPAQGRAPVDLGDVTLEVGLAIRGRVRDQAGAAVAGASLNAFPARPMGGAFTFSETASEADGSFVLAGLADGPYRLTARLSGYAETTQQASPGGERIEIVLRPGGAITGLVADEDGRPVESFGIDAEPTSRTAGGMIVRGGRQRVVDPQGRFTIEDLAEGTYVVRAETPEMVAGSASGVKVVPGQTTDAGVVRLSRGGVVRGSVVDNTGAPVPGATISVRGPGMEMVFRGDNTAATSDAAGLFEARGVPLGKVDLTATHPSYAAGRVSVEVAAKSPAEARVVMTQGGRIEGLARKRDGAPLAGRIQAMPAQMGMGMDMASHPPMVSLAGDGSFAVEHVAPGRWRVMLMQGGVSQLTSTLSKEVEVREGETAGVELITRDILISGRVTRGGVPQPGLRVNIRVRSSGRMVMSFSPGAAAPPSGGPQRGTASTREDGSFELLVDEPGEASVSVESPDGKTSLLSRSEVIPDADNHAVDLALSGVSVSGIVVDKATEKGVAEARVFAARPNADGAGVTGAESGADGRFAMEVEPGDIRLRVRASGYAEGGLDLNVGQGGLNDVRLELVKGEALEGRVVDAQGRPVPGLPVTAMSAGPREGRSTGFTNTLADGTFRLEGVANKPHAVLAGSPRAGYAFRPSAAPGARDVVLTLQPGGKVQVQVVGPGGEPVDGATVSLESLGGVPAFMPFGNPTTNSQGVAELDLPSGTVELDSRKGDLRGRGTVNVGVGGAASLEIKLSGPGKKSP